MHPDPVVVVVVVEVAFENGYQMPERKKMKRVYKQTQLQFEGEKF